MYLNCEYQKCQYRVFIKIDFVAFLPCTHIDKYSMSEEGSYLVSIVVKHNCLFKLIFEKYSTQQYESFLDITLNG